MTACEIQRVFWPLVLVAAGLFSACVLGRDAGHEQEPAAFAVDLTQIPDGSYRGNHQVEDINFQVAVSVVSHQIVGIKVLDGMQRVFQKKCALCQVNDLIWEIIELQSVDVDAVSGATRTSAAILRAVTNALTPPFSRD